MDSSSIVTIIFVSILFISPLYFAILAFKRKGKKIGIAILIATLFGFGLIFGPILLFNPSPKRIPIIMAIFVIYFVSGFSLSVYLGQPNEVIPTPNAVIPTPIPTVIPARTIPVVLGWNIPVKTVCLDANIIFPPTDKSATTKIDDVVRETITGLGMQVVSNESDCEAKMSIYVEGEALSADYSFSQITRDTYYTGGTIIGNISMEKPGYEPIIFNLQNRQDPPNDLVLDQNSAAPTKPGDYEFEFLWGKVLIKTLSEIWGPRALVWIAVVNDYQLYDESLNQLQTIGQPKDVILDLLYMSNDPDSLKRDRAKKMLNTILSTPTP